jgi:hypothetical protein
VNADAVALRPLEAPRAKTAAAPDAAVADNIFRRRYWNLKDGKDARADSALPRSPPAHARNTPKT